MKREVLFSHKTDEWSTPQDFYDALDAEFGFDLDPCATAENAKCERFFTKEDDGLKQNWGGCRVFCNPPYSQVAAWIRKCSEESKNAIVVALVPARTDTRWFHEYAYGKAEVRFIKGRLKFSNAKNNAPFPVMVIVWNKADKKDIERHPHGAI